MAKIAEATARDLQAEKDEVTESKRNPDLLRRWASVLAFKQRYKSLMDSAGFGSKAPTRTMLSWIDKTNLTADEKAEDGIYWREDYINKDGMLILETGESLTREFTRLMAEASPYISLASKERWKERFLYTEEKHGSSPSIFRQKLAWITNELPQYIDRWKKVADDREKLEQEKGFEDLLQYEPKFAILRKGNKEQFLDLHYEVRKGLLAEARGALLATGKLQLDLYAEAKSKLESAHSKGFLGDGKVGIWLERIFKSNASPKKIEKFIRELGPNTLSDLMINWYQVWDRYEKVRGKVQGLSEAEMPRGFSLVGPSQFLTMHYAQRLQYVHECESRLRDTEDINTENPLILRIRHEIDNKDWEEAQELINHAWTKDSLNQKDRERLKSMQRYVTQFSSSTKKVIPVDRMAEVTGAHKRINQIVEELGQTHSQVQPMVLRLLGGPNANRSINQFRWISYNNRWCRTHGFLNPEIARMGASQHNQELTRQRAVSGQDIGRHDVQSYDTAGRQFIRKDEYANHKATYRHINVKDGMAVNKTAEWLEREQNTKVLYWTTFCAHEDGDPKSEIWHDDLFYMLTELRSLTRTLGNAGFQYGGINRPLIGRN